MNVKQVEYEECDEIIFRDKRTIVLFSRPTCEMCDKARSFIESSEGDDDVFEVVAKEGNLAICNKYSIHVVPTLVIFESGLILGYVIGFQPSDERYEKLFAENVICSASLK